MAQDCVTRGRGLACAGAGHLVLGTGCPPVPWCAGTPTPAEAMPNVVSCRQPTSLLAAEDIVNATFLLAPHHVLCRKHTVEYRDGDKETLELHKVCRCCWLPSSCLRQADLPSHRRCHSLFFLLRAAVWGMRTSDRATRQASSGRFAAQVHNCQFQPNRQISKLTTWEWLSSSRPSGALQVVRQGRSSCASFCSQGGQAGAQGKGREGGHARC